MVIFNGDKSVAPPVLETAWECFLFDMLRRNL